jgi:5'(3')-deoxyribonucleotidase
MYVSQENTLLVSDLSYLPFQQWEVEFDMDGVLVNFVDSYKELIGVDFFSMESDEERWTLMLEKHPTFFLDAKPLDRGMAVFIYVKMLTKAKVEILTAIPRAVAVPGSTHHKREWSKNNLGEEIKVKFGPYSIDKQYHCKGHKRHVLIDDNHLNCDQWEARGGTAILFTDAKSAIDRLKEIGLVPEIF